MVSGVGKAHKRTFGSKGWYFVLTALFAAFTASVMLADSFRSYESEVSVLVIPKSEVAAVSLGEIVVNIGHITRTDAFRSAFFDALSEKSGAFDDLSAAARGDAMERMVTVRAEKKGSVLSIRAVADDADDARVIARQAALTLLGSVGQYYNLKEDIDLRVMNGPTASARVMSPGLFILSSAVSGIGVASIFFLTLFGLPDVIAFFERKRRFSGNTLDAKVFEPEMPTSSVIRDTIETDRETAAAVIAERETPSVSDRPVPAEAPVSAPSADGKKGSAPSNLPSLSEAEEQFLREFSFEGSLEREEADEMKTVLAVPAPTPEVQPTADHEPTEEEYKRRLNELLKG